LLIRTEWRHYRLACDILLPRIQFQSSSSLSVASVMCTFSAGLLLNTRCWQALK
jgi:hypothetical protein